MEEYGTALQHSLQIRVGAECYVIEAQHTFVPFGL